MLSILTLGEEDFVDDLSDCRVGEDVSAEFLYGRAISDGNTCDEDKLRGGITQDMAPE